MTTSMDSVDAEFAIAERRCAIQAIMREKSRSQLESRASMTSKRMPPADQTRTLYPEYGQRHPPSIYIYFFFLFPSLAASHAGKRQINSAGMRYTNGISTTSEAPPPQSCTITAVRRCHIPAIAAALSQTYKLPCCLGTSATAALLRPQQPQLSHNHNFYPP